MLLRVSSHTMQPVLLVSPFGKGFSLLKYENTKITTNMNTVIITVLYYLNSKLIKRTSPHSWQTFPGGAGLMSCTLPWNRNNVLHLLHANFQLGLLFSSKISIPLQGVELPSGIWGQGQMLLWTALRVHPGFMHELQPYAKFVTWKNEKINTNSKSNHSDIFSLSFSVRCQRIWFLCGVGLRLTKSAFIAPFCR